MCEHLHRRIEPERLCRRLHEYNPSSSHNRGHTIQEGTKVFHVADVIVGRASLEANVFSNLFTKTLENVRVLSQQVDRKGERRSGLITWTVSVTD